LQPLAILFGAAFTVVVSASLGALLLRGSSEDPAIRFVSGAAVLSLLVFLACALRLAYPAVFLGLGVACIAGARSHWTLPKYRRLTRWSVPFVPFFILYFFNSMAPEISYDGSRYHLALVGRYLQEHGFRPVFDNFYAAFPQGVEMLYLFGYAFGRHSAAAMIHFSFLLALAWQLYAWAERRESTLAGWCAAALVFISPIVGVDGSSAYNDVALACIAFTLFHVLALWNETRSPRLLVVAGLLAGFAFTAKYTAFLAMPAAVAFVGLKTRQIRPAVIAAALSALSVTAWMLKNYLWFQNPLAPFFNHWFPNPYITHSFEIDYRAGLSDLGVFRGWLLPLQITTLGSLSGLLGPVFLLAPVALLGWGRPEVRALLLSAALFAVAWFGNVTTRFLIPALPFVALAMSFVLARWARLAVMVVALHALISWPSIVRLYSRPDAWHLVKVPYREALRIKPEDGFLESNLPYYGIMRRIDELTPAGATVFADVPVPDAYTSRNILVAYQSASATLSKRVWFSGFVPEHAPKARLRFQFRARNVGAFRLVQTGTGREVWTIHEVRAFDSGRELDRRRWRATADPFPWGIEAALDGRSASLWMCGEKIRPGQFVQIDLQSAERADSVVVETAPDQPESRVVLQAPNPADGKWENLAGAVLEETAEPEALRRSAAKELKRRGIDYLLTFEGQFGADDLRSRAVDWGVTPVVEYKGARLYQLP
jgi:hypothetical protein